MRLNDRQSADFDCMSEHKAGFTAFQPVPNSTQMQRFRSILDFIVEETEQRDLGGRHLEEGEGALGGGYVGFDGFDVGGGQESADFRFGGAGGQTC